MIPRRRPMEGELLDDAPTTLPLPWPLFARPRFLMGEIRYEIKNINGVDQQPRLRTHPDPSREVGVSVLMKKALPRVKSPPSFSLPFAKKKSLDFFPSLLRSIIGQNFVRDRISSPPANNLSRRRSNPKKGEHDLDGMLHHRASLSGVIAMEMGIVGDYPLFLLHESTDGSGRNHDTIHRAVVDTIIPASGPASRTGARMRCPRR